MAAPSFSMSDFKKLRVWRKAHALTLNAHRVAASIRGRQYAALRSQMIRAAMSVTANIVEGREQNRKGNSRASSATPWRQLLNSNTILSLRATSG